MATKRAKVTAVSSIGLYSTGSKLQLPLSSLVEEYKVAKVRQAVMLRDSNDKYVSGAGIKLRSGRKWQVEEAVNLAEERLRQSDIIGTVTHGRLGLGCITRSRFSSASKQRKRELVQDEVRQGEEEARLTKAVAQKKQGSWLGALPIIYEYVLKNYSPISPINVGWDIDKLPSNISEYTLMTSGSVSEEIVESYKP